ncbi:DNA-directed RNA polymerase sigma-70 factor [Pseudofrankia inefficax]|uniref:Sigma-70 region 4 domain protein n=1 Tax=Pseudofrankia inefficax (strain DSM 45817 / CECT 9037 / DDB 130130 / EuI1c) TaxID=298654 RepID=E3J671_PSEI1|nr:DNA-directed RNA polymerase sigma-70 factor [Pseudofrankia inefficax]ADP78362.1 sigma-70 region 4 domain protein [Pseudofrankia inefficax]
MGDVPQLWTTKDIGAHLGISRERARQLSHGDDFPAPVGQVGHIRMWSAPDVEAWATEHRPDKADAGDAQ